ncbi:MAG: N-acetylmuramoyl-L-alanine amidase [Gemmatimonadota bacterium]
MRLYLLAVAILIAGAAFPVEADAQSRADRWTPSPDDAVRIVGLGGSEDVILVPLHRDRGFAAISARTLSDLGWTLSRGGETLGVALDDGPAFRAHAGTPFLLWQGQRVQLAYPPYMEGRDFFLPFQVISDVLPYILDDLYSYDSGSRTLRVGTPVAALRRPEPSPVSVVVIDPGHGGHDPGARGPGGTREKDVALAIGLALARELAGDPTLEVHLIRDADVYVHPWERGEIALGLKGDRPGVFLSIHANAMPSSRAVRGFETYFLSEARTEHERRVAAVENAPVYTGRVSDTGPSDDTGLTSILRELRYVDDQHWSALLADMVQNELAVFHPGPNRGVKQGPLAVLTNSLMPSALIEVGFLTHREEERLLADASFQQDAAASIARAVRSFFGRYPPGRASSVDR